jgi:4-hydroxybenzoate polyprenyltransferase
VLGAFPVEWLYAAAVGMMAGLLLIEHRVVANNQDVLAIDRAFFRVNVLVSMSFFVLTFLDRLLLA